MELLAFIVFVVVVYVAWLSWKVGEALDMIRNHMDWVGDEYDNENAGLVGKFVSVPAMRLNHDGSMTEIFIQYEVLATEGKGLWVRDLLDEVELCVPASFLKQDRAKVMG